MSRDFKIAVVTTVYRRNSHSDVMVSRWIEPRPRDGEFGWARPRTRIASMFAAQFPEHDTARGLCAKHGIPLFDTVRGALTLGGDRLAVDGVLLIGEHGDYPLNEVGQKLYPRKELFDQIVAVFRREGRSAPVFYDKHLSWNFDWAREIINTVRELRIPFLAGSSLPYAPLVPPIHLPAGCEIEEALGVFYGGQESYGFHSMEAVQALIENRRGGETGIRSVQAFQKDGVQRALTNGAWSADLMNAALSKANPVQKSATPHPPAPKPKHPDLAPSPVAYRLEHHDGLRVVHVSVEGRLADFCLALRLKGDPTIHAARVALEGEDLFYAHFARLNRVIEDMFLTGVAPVPVERTLLTTGVIAACMNALQREGERIETPQLRIPYACRPSTGS